MSCDSDQAMQTGGVEGLHWQGEGAAGKELAIGTTLLPHSLTDNWLKGPSPSPLPVLLRARGPELEEAVAETCVQVRFLVSMVTRSEAV